MRIFVHNFTFQYFNSCSHNWKARNDLGILSEWTQHSGLYSLTEYYSVKEWTTDTQNNLGQFPKIL